MALRPPPYHYYQGPKGNYFRTRTQILPLPKDAKYFGKHKEGKAAWLQAQSSDTNQRALAGESTGVGGWLSDKLQGLKTFAAGEPSKELRFEQLTPEQKALFSDYYLPFIREQIAATQGKTDEDWAKGFDPFAQQAREQYNRSIPLIADRFGIGGARGADFLQALRSGQGDLETQLQTQRAQYGQQAKQNQMQNVLGGLGYGFSPQFENAYIPRQPGFLENVLAGGAGGIGKAIGTKLMGGY